MKKTIFITGASTGIGKATAKHFHENGWNVIATMRKPEEEKELIQDESLKIMALDVENKENIKSAIQSGIAHFG
jgi:NADP-dependent 3-hydroxy acid dehydrogenase YdfG